MQPTGSTNKGEDSFLLDNNPDIGLVNYSSLCLSVCIIVVALACNYSYETILKQHVWHELCTLCSLFTKISERVYFWTIMDSLDQG